MYLIHAACYYTDEDGVVDEGNIMEERIVFCGQKDEVDSAQEKAKSDLSEEADFVKVYDLTLEDDREEALTKIALNDPFALDH